VLFLKRHHVVLPLWIVTRGLLGCCKRFLQC